MPHPAWYETILKENKKEAISSAIFSIAVSCIFSLWYFWNKEAFHWKDLDPFSSPLSYAFYSALVFVGPGSYLYHKTKVYIHLWKIRKFDYHLHKDVKRVFWWTMVAGMAVVVYLIVTALNLLVSLVYNLTFVTLHLLPLVGMLAGTFLICYFLFTLLKHRAEIQ